MNGSDLLLHCLRTEGCDALFTVPDRELLPVLDAAQRAGVRLVVHHQQHHAGLAAAAYGCGGRRPGYVLVGPGAGATLLTTAVATATADGFPLVAMVVDGDSRRRLRAGDSPMHLTQTLAPVAKALLHPRTPSELRDDIRRATRMAYREKPGAVVILVPAEMMTATCSPEIQPLPPYQMGKAYPDPAAVDNVADVLAGSHRAVVLAGHGVLRSGAHEELIALAEQAHLPVVTTVMGKAAIPFEHSQCAGVVGTGGPAERLLRECDTVLAVGYDQEEWPADGFNATLDKRIVFLGERPLKADVHFSPEVEVLGDLNAALAGLVQRIGRRDRRGWAGAEGVAADVKRQIVQEMEEARANAGVPVHPGRLALELRRAMDKQDILVCDVGAHQQWIAHLYPVQRPGTFYTSGCFETMGSALPLAIGVAMAFGQNHHVVACMGDGGYLAAAGEIETACRLRLPLTVVVATDEAYGQTKVEALQATGQASGTNFATMDIAAHAQALGARGVHCTDPQRLGEALDEAHRSAEVTVIAVPVQTLLPSRPRSLADLVR